MTFTIGVGAFKWLSFTGGFICGFTFFLGLLCIWALFNMNLFGR